MADDFSLYAMKIQPGDADPDTDAFEFCRQEEIVGIGWAIDFDRVYESVDDVYDAHEEVVERRKSQDKETARLLQDGRLMAPIRYILKRMDPGDYVWVNEGNQHVLCEITSDWKVSANLPEDQAQEYDRRDIQHYREVNWVDVPYSLVPGYVRRQFSRRMKTIQKFSDVSDDQRRVVKSLHSNVTRTSGSLDRESIANKIENTDPDRLFEILGAEETEDIVVSYLQSLGWHVIKSSTSNSQAKIECELRRDVGGESVPGYLQVKTGSAGLNPSSYQEYADEGEMFFFVQSGVDTTDYEGMTTINPETIRDYMASDFNYLPVEPLLKLDYSL